MIPVAAFLEIMSVVMLVSLIGVGVVVWRER